MAFHKLPIAEFLFTAGEVHIGNVFRCVNAIHKIRGYWTSRTLSQGIANSINRRQAEGRDRLNPYPVYPPRLKYCVQNKWITIRLWCSRACCLLHFSDFMMTRVRLVIKNLKEVTFLRFKIGKTIL